MKLKEGRLAFRFDALRWPSNGLLLLQAALVAGLAVQGVRLFWMLVTPAGAFGVAAVIVPPRAKADFSVLSRFDPFYREMPAGGASATIAFTLFGVRMAAAGRSAAILGSPDGRQDSFTLGQSVAPGVVLAAVERDHVVLTRGGVRMRVGFPTQAPAAYVPLPARAAAAQADQGGAITPKAFLSQTMFEPQLQGGQVTGYAVSPRDGGQILGAAGLQAGDVIRAINGSVLSRNRFEEIESEFAGVSQVELTIERGGQTLTRKLQVAK
jgi:general secretion pathway protein C